MSGHRQLGEVDGITVVLTGVERDATSVTVRMTCPPNVVTQGLDARHEADFEAWTAVMLAARERGERAADPPVQPGALLNALPLVLADDVGTAYVASRRHAGGTGTEWDGEWTFQPAPPAQARTLWIRLGVPGGRTLTVALHG